ncbi:MAG: DUF3810 domain-containing protein [Lachnospiraceae bacterium]|nr:DUF3810 domain-containing protein [Lachnospiraceae bacterium]
MLMKSISPKNRRRLFLLAGCAVFLAASWLSRGFADWYVSRVFPLWGKTYGRLTSLAPFSVGEWAILFVLVWLAVFLLRLLFALTGKKGTRLARMGKMPGKTADLFIFIAWIMCLNCFTLYHCTPLDTRADSRSYSQAELAALRDLIVEECNARALTQERDDAGRPRLPVNCDRKARDAVAALGDRLFPRLSGYSVKPKVFFFSDFVSQQEMMGYYFPFTMEANINGRMEPLNKPFTMCHELAHTHGYLYEDEANLLGFLACLSSEEPAFVYSGYLGVLPYVNNDFLNSVGKEVYRTHPAISDQVMLDLQFLSEESRVIVEKNALLDTELVQSAADAFIDQNQKLNGIAAGKASYSHVVALLLSYYAGEASYLK